MTDAAPPSKPKLTLPGPAAALVRAEYAKARAIVEYGTGGSTVIAAERADCTIFGVESDPGWLAMMQAWFDYSPPAGTVHLHHGDIGPTKAWGYPVDEKPWRRFIGYPLSVWDRPDFRHPDLVMIDGRFRVGCFLATLINITRPVTILFDDYADRPHYHVVEEFLAPQGHAGRMARFEAAPAPHLLQPRMLHQLIGMMQEPG